MTLDELKALVARHHGSRRQGAQRKSYPWPLRQHVLDFIDAKEMSQYEVCEALNIGSSTIRRWRNEQAQLRAPTMTRLKNVVSVSTVDHLRGKLEEERRKGLVIGNHGYSDGIVLQVGCWARGENVNGITHKELGRQLGVSAGTIAKSIKVYLAREAHPADQDRWTKVFERPKATNVDLRRKTLWGLLEGAKERQDVDSAIEILRMIGELPNAK